MPREKVGKDLGRGAKVFSLPASHQSPIFSLAVFSAVPQLVKLIKQANQGPLNRELVLVGGDTL